MTFSANLGFLWTELALPAAIEKAAAAGFDAVEFHYPYTQDRAAVKAALAATQLPVMGLNTERGEAGQNGLAALPGRQADARALIDQAFDWAADLGARNVHVMAGFASGDAAREQFLANLNYAADVGERAGVGVLIEPLNAFDAPNYFLNRIDQALAILAEVDRANVRLMFDCYHVARTEGDILAQFDHARARIGHVQFAGAPDRGAPDLGTVNYAPVFAHIAASGWDQPLGAEYKPGGDTDQSLGWLASLRTA